MKAFEFRTMTPFMERSMPGQDSDHELLRRIAAGDAEALRELYAVYGRRLYTFALRIVGDPAAAEDALQESLLSVWQGAHRYRGEGRVLAWLLSIVRHKALSALRVRQPLDWEAVAPDLPDQSPLPDEQASSNESRRLLRAGMERLPVEQRLLLELVFYQGLSLNEAAEVCGCPVGTVKSRLSYAKASLRGVLSREGFPREGFPQEGFPRETFPAEENS